MIETIRTHRTPPEWFVTALNSVGGMNPFGGPNFDVVWSESATIMRDGKEALAFPGPPCWVLRQWESPEAYGPPELWELEQTGEPYPQFGKYEARQPFRCSYIENGVLKHDFMELNSLILDFVVPLIKMSVDVTYEKRRLALEEMREREEKEKQDKIEARIRDAAPAWMGPISYSRMKDSNSVLQKKMFLIEKAWQGAMQFAKLRGMGPSVEKPQLVLPN